jgi:hypothetical protein
MPLLPPGNDFFEAMERTLLKEKIAQLFTFVDTARGPGAPDQSGLGHYWKFYRSDMWPDGVVLDLLAHTFSIAGYTFAVTELRALPLEDDITPDASEVPPSDTTIDAPAETEAAPELVPEPEPDILSLNVGGFSFKINKGDKNADDQPPYLLSEWQVTVDAVKLTVEARVDATGVVKRAPTVEATTQAGLVSSNSGAIFFAYVVKQTDFQIN